MEETPYNKHPDIKGWGVDIDKKNDPTYPIKKRTDEEQRGYSWKRPPQQPIDIEVLTSIERPNVSAVFGTSAPPRGLSGAIRRFAYKYGEGSHAHWVPLIMADRIDEVEGVFEDISHGHVPNFFAEKGYRAQWKHNRQGVIRKIIVGGVLATATLAFLFSRKSSR